MCASVGNLSVTSLHAEVVDDTCLKFNAASESLFCI